MELKSMQFDSIFLSLSIYLSIYLAIYSKQTVQCMDKITFGAQQWYSGHLPLHTPNGIYYSNWLVNKNAPKETCRSSGRNQLPRARNSCPDNNVHANPAWLQKHDVFLNVITLPAMSLKHFFFLQPVQNR